LRNGAREVSGYFADPETGLMNRIRPDFLSFNLNALVDIKTTDDCEMNAFSRTIWNYRYDFQLAMYSEGVRLISGKAPDYHAYIAIEKTPPFEVAVYIADDSVLDKGLQDYKKAIRLLSECLEKNSWPKYQEKMENINLPAWAY
jgi:hypothetical protein